MWVLYLYYVIVSFFIQNGMVDWYKRYISMKCAEWMIASVADDNYCGKYHETEGIKPI